MKFDLSFFESMARHSEVSPSLLFALARVESNLDPNTARFEPEWRYHLDTSLWAKKLGITRDTERALQSFSWGLMQVMGTVAREHGFDRHLTELINPQLNVLIAIRKIEQLQKKYSSMEDVISSYNQGWPRKNADGTYRNQRYVDTVLGFEKSC